MIIGNLSFAFLGEFLGVCAWGLFFLCGWGGMNGGRDEYVKYLRKFEPTKIMSNADGKEQRKFFGCDSTEKWI